MKTTNGWRHLLVVVGILFLLAGCQQEGQQQKPPRTVKAVRESGNMYAVSIADTPGVGGRPWTMMLVAPDCTNYSSFPDSIIFSLAPADTSGGQ